MIHHFASAKLGWTLLVIGVAGTGVSVAEHIDALISTVPSVLSVVVGIIIILRGQKQLHVLLNSRLSQLLEQTRISSHAEGKEDERIEVAKAAAAAAAKTTPRNE